MKSCHELLVFGSARVRLLVGALAALGVITSVSPSISAMRLQGQVQAGGAPVANSIVTLWSAGQGQPEQIAQTRTNERGEFALNSQDDAAPDVDFYVVAKGGSLPPTKELATTLH